MPSYRVDIDDPRTHQFRVTLTLSAPAAEQRLSLPVWVPGSYLVREFARHVSRLEARQGQRALAVEALDKASWRVRCEGRAALVVSYLVHASDVSVRAAFLDARRGFFNGTSLFLRAEGREAEAHTLLLGKRPPDWDVATALPAGKAGHFEAADYDALVDAPVELGSFWRGSFRAGGVPHELVVTGALPGFDGARLLADVQRVCEAQIRFWHGDKGKPPFKRYVFLLNAVEDGFSGLEHRNSSALVAARRDLPRREMEGLPDGYVTLLSLVSHEYFHAWNVKRMTPRELAAPDYTRENYTRLLWFFEGFTSYYDDLLLLRAGLIDAQRYLKLLAKSINAVALTPGRQVQSLAESSFDAWTKYYRPDENTLNATVSYYQKGALAALAFDLTLRATGSSLDAAMRALWARSAGGAIDEDDIAAVFAELAGRSLAPELAAWVHGRDELPLAPLLAEFGIDWRVDRAGWAASLGLVLAEGPVSGVRVKHVLAGGAAMAAGLSAGDELLAIDGWRIRRFDEAQAWVARGALFELLLVRDQRVLSLRVAPPKTAELAETVTLGLADPSPAEAKARRRAWLDG